MVNMWSDFAARIYGFDGMLPRTLSDLTIRPGQVAHDYIIGNRVKYYGPLGYFFLTLTVYLLLASLLEVDLVNFMMQTNPSNVEEQGGGVQEVVREITRWTIDNMRSISFFITLFTVFFTWLLFKKSRYNFVETGALVFFTTGHFMWVSIVLIVVYKMSGLVLDSFYLLLASMAFMIYAFVNFYSHLSKWKIIVRGIFVHILSYTVLAFVIIGATIYRISTDKALYEKIRPSNNKPKVEQSPAVK
ncbi:DUF3667 domain-containing protein [Chryseotalea sanaruensis]|uniref:DUF3667 domain-containing protein n=2 Tax=Chryseotalea sanaruensis TaxID=2482724 RepID=A0A401U4M5_9BACT|nr:DUF3667 domain-containing protein [Chryseotalea sanaruensis]